MSGLSSASGLHARAVARAGPELAEECASLAQPPPIVGEALVTGGYALYSRHVLHLIAPKSESHIEKLRLCYDRALGLAKANG